MNTVWLDMDGTIANFYGVENWLEDLRTGKTRPYEIAKGLYDSKDLNKVLFNLKARGYKVGIVSWSAKYATTGYTRRIKEAKIQWLKKQGIYNLLDEILITEYGIRKADTCRKYGRGILVDDERRNREEWDLGLAIDATENILDILEKL